MSASVSSFQTALETIEGLTLEEQEMLFEIVYHRFIERRRAGLAGEITTAREAYRRGEVQRGSVEELMAELAE
jgi:DNA replication initiation complex subunit (GINS family)